MLENRLRIKFTYSLNILWRHLENTEFADLPHLRLGFYFHRVFTKSASIRKDLAALELHSPADLCYDRWDQLSCFKWQSPQEDREGRRLAITHNPSKHKSDFSKILTESSITFTHTIQQIQPKSLWGENKLVEDFCFENSHQSLSVIRRHRQALQHMVRNPCEAWVEAGLFIMPTMEEDIEGGWVWEG